MYPLMYTKQKRGDNRQLVAVNSATGKVNLRRLYLSLSLSLPQTNERMIMFIQKYQAIDHFVFPINLDIGR